MIPWYVFVIIVLFFIISCLFWIWLLIGVRKTGFRKFVGQVAIQLSVLCFLYFGILRGDPSGAISAALSPPFALASFRRFDIFWELIEQILPYTSVVFLLTFLGCILLKKLRVWSVGLALGISLISTVFIAENISKETMCQTALALGVTQIQRNTFFWSLRNAPREFQFEVHAIAKKDEIQMGWSYRNMNWYEIPRKANADVNGGEIIRCT